MNAPDRISATVLDIASSAARMAAIPKVYSFYLAYRASKGLGGADPENIIARVGQIETVGDCKYAIPVSDFEGNRYLVTVEVLSRGVRA